MKAPLFLRDTGVRITDVLEAIENGHSCEQILKQYPKLTGADFQCVAKIARQLIKDYVTSEDTIELYHEIKVTASGQRVVNLSKIREEFPRAFQPWTKDEEERLVDMFTNGVKLEEIARAHGRQLGAVRMRLKRLGLIK